MLEIAAVALVVLCVGAVLGARFLRLGPGPVRVFCPSRGRMAEIRGDRCHAEDDSGVVGSPWECQRECLLPGEAEVARQARAGS
jgi:hypothetical protein